MSNWSSGFADEIEKLALRLPSMGEMTSGLGPSAPAPAAEAAPAAAPQQQVHVHVHPQGGGKAGGSKPKASLPKPPQDAPGPIKHSTEPENLPMKPGGYQTSAEVGAQTLMPKAPAFSGGTQKPLHNYSSQMKNYVDEGTGPTKQYYVDPSAPFRDTRKFDAPKTPFTNITMGDVMGGTTDDLRNPMAGLVEGKSPARGAKPLPGSVAGAPASAGGQKFEMQQMASPKPKKKMFGTALASNDEPVKI